MESLMEWMGGYIWVTAFVLGAIHALQPGHGKTIVAAYLVGARGTIKDAILLGIVVTITHTLVIYILAAISGWSALYFSWDEIEGVLGAFASLLILVVGLALLRANWPGRASAHSHAAHPHDGHTHAHQHSHEHPHDHPHAHSHAHIPGLPHVHATPEEMTSLSRVLMLGVSGGIVPCPEGLAVFLASVAGGQMEKGVLLVMVFSLGLAATLVAVGILFLKASSLFNQTDSAGKWGARISLFSAVLITLVGLIYFGKYVYYFAMA